MGPLLGCLLGDGSVSDLLGPAAKDTPDHTNRPNQDSQKTVVI